MLLAGAKWRSACIGAHREFDVHVHMIPPARDGNQPDSENGRPVKAGPSRG